MRSRNPVSRWDIVIRMCLWSERRILGSYPLRLEGKRPAHHPCQWPPKLDILCRASIDKICLPKFSWWENWSLGRERMSEGLESRSDQKSVSRLVQEDVIFCERCSRKGCSSWCACCHSHHRHVGARIRADPRSPSGSAEGASSPIDRNQGHSTVLQMLQHGLSSEKGFDGWEKPDSNEWPRRRRQKSLLRRWAITGSSLLRERKKSQELPFQPA